MENHPSPKEIKVKVMITIPEQQIDAAVDQIQASGVFDAHMLTHAQVKRAFVRFLTAHIEGLLEDPEYLIRNVDMHGKFGLPYPED
jgi:hypothetical protein